MRKNLVHAQVLLKLFRQPYWVHLGDSFEEVIGFSHFEPQTHFQNFRRSLFKIKTRRRPPRPATCGHWAHLEDSFDEVICFITTSALPGCADRSVSPSEYRRTEYDEKLS